MTGGTFFTGFGICDLALREEGVDMLWGVESESDIAEVCRKNTHHRVLVQDVLALNVKALEAVDFFHCSPPCTRYSQGNSKAGESRLDVDLARKITEYLEHHRPRLFTLENVPAYIHGEAFRSILSALLRLGYGFSHAVLNAADYGVPQTRKRLFLWAKKEGHAPLMIPATHIKSARGGLFDVSRPWVSWFSAVEDLVEGLEETYLAGWQLKKMGAVGGSGLLDGINSSRELTIRADDEPSFTVLSSHLRRPSSAPKILQVSSNQSSTGRVPMRGETRPSLTVTTTSQRFRIIGNGAWSRPVDQAPPSPTITANHNQGSLRVQRGVSVKQVSPRCLARWQAIPDSYLLPHENLPGSKRLACTGIGNAVPMKLMQAVAKQLLK